MRSRPELRVGGGRRVRWPLESVLRSPDEFVTGRHRELSVRRILLRTQLGAAFGGFELFRLLDHALLVPRVFNFPLNGRRGPPAWLTGVHEDATLTFELAKVCPYVPGGGATEPLVEARVDFHHDVPTRDRATLIESLENLALAHLAVGDEP